MKSLLIIGFCLFVGNAAEAEFAQPIGPRASTVVNVNVFSVRPQPVHSVFNGCMTGACGNGGGYRYATPMHGGYQNWGMGGQGGYYGQGGYGQGGYYGQGMSCGHRHHRGNRCGHRGRCCGKRRRPFAFNLSFGGFPGFSLSFARF